MVDDSILKMAASHLPDLQVLRLGRCGRISDHGCQHIAKLVKLTELDLRATYVTSNGTAFLTSLVGLQHLDLKRCQRLTNVTFDHFGVLTNLCTLNISKCLHLTAPHANDRSTRLSVLTNLTALKASHGLYVSSFLSQLSDSLPASQVNACDDAGSLTRRWVLSSLA
jgi:hypothetical protein